MSSLLRACRRSVFEIATSPLVLINISVTVFRLR